VKDVSLDCATIIAWWWRLPDANLGIATGGDSQLIVVDIDPRSGGIDSLLRIEGEHSATRTFSVRTGSGGRHDYYRLPPGVRIECPKRSWPGIDILGEGRYAVAPPSLHASGRRYEVIDNLPVAPAPAWLLEALNASQVQHLTEQNLGTGNGAQLTAPAAAEPSLGAIPPTVMRAADDAPEPKGERNVYHNKAEVLVRQFANHCNPPLPKSEAARALVSAWKHTPGFQCTDVGNAQRLAYQHGRDIRFVADMGQRIVWDGKRWRTDVGRIEIIRRAMNTVRSIYAEARDEHDIDRRGRLASWAKQSEYLTRINAMIDLAAPSEPQIAITSDALDADPMLLGVKNGTLDLRTGELRAPRREDYITKVAPVAFDPDAKCPEWLQFLEEITGGDKGLIGYLQRLLGYALTGDISKQV
jgi:putative DNA primase/helicase